MSHRIVVDKIWLHDYIARLRVQRQDAMKLVLSLNKTKLSSPQSEWPQFDVKIKQAYQVVHELDVMADILEQYLCETEVAARRLRRDMAIEQEHIRRLL